MGNKFNPTTKRIISSRAGYQCSYPGCQRVLIGPGAEQDTVTNIGDCAHIFCAGDDGPRGQGGLSPAELKSPSNGIYLCKIHHKIIDTDDGKKYPPSLLLEFKNRQEFSISREIGDYYTEASWIKSFCILEYHFFSQPIEVSLGKVTHIYGDNGAGKTVFCDLLYSSLSGILIERLRRWDFKTRIDAVYMDDKPVMFEHKNEKITYHYDKKDSPMSFLNVNVVYLRESWHYSKDHIEEIAKCFHISPSVILQLFHNECFTDSLWFKEVKVEVRRKEPYLVRKVLINKDGFDVELGACSGSELGLLLIEIGIRLARYYSLTGHAIYIIEWSNIYCISKSYMDVVLNELQKTINSFQSIIVSPDKLNRFDWSGWEIAKFQGICPNSTVEQNII